MDLTHIFPRLGSQADVFDVSEIVFTILLSFLLSLVIATVYRATYRGTSYTQSFVHTIIILAVVVSVIMLIVGSNIARAFSLVGALSVIRFRNAIKETRDVGYLFLAMAIGMACGTRFYLVAVVSTFLTCFLLWGMNELNLFARDITSHVLKVRIPADVPFKVLDDVFAKYLVRANQIQVETVEAGLLEELMFDIQFRKGASIRDFLTELRQRNNNNKVVLLSGYHEADL